MKQAMIGPASMRWNQWNVLLWVQQESAWSTKGEYRETPWIVTLKLACEDAYWQDDLIKGWWSIYNETQTWSV
jgi:hypothetical protein